MVVVDQVFVAQGNPEYPLTHQTRHLVNHQIGITVIGKAAGKALDQPDLLIGSAKQHRPGFRGHRAAVKRGHYLVPLNRCKPNRSALHSVCIGTPPDPEINRSVNSIFSDPGPRCTYPFEKYRLIAS